MDIEYWLAAFAQTVVIVGVVAWKFGILTGKVIEVERRLGRLEDQMNNVDRQGD